MNESKIVGFMAKLDVVHNLFVEDVNYVGGRGYQNQRLEHQRGNIGVYGNGQPNYTHKSQFQQPFQYSSSFSFTRNYDLASYQAPPPPAQRSKIESLPEQILEGQKKILERYIPRWTERRLTPSWHVALMESEDEFLKVEESDEFDVVELCKLRVFRRVLVRSFYDCAGKRSVPPIPDSHPADAPLVLDRPNALTAYTPTWMMRGLSPRYLLPPFEPPDSRNPLKSS
ncbi:hypothetical protein [Arabidopsis thaliana]|uniref:Uncharacterized protein AT4g08130 n=1 Tax=Arabidopsis thaliana TaxID=3702 RepID=Q9SYE5_ARATH|nr:hypothetical protein [Arabidopsis thaliana]CAB81149.1 hypothetical protein [Arabidopsis thaliana]